MLIEPGFKLPAVCLANFPDGIFSAGCGHWRSETFYPLASHIESEQHTNAT